MIDEMKQQMLQWEEKTIATSKHHPYCACLAVVIGLPLLLILAITTISAGIMLPILWLCGCM
ncbi:MAG: hypothetical protein RSC76_01905 [Oscillospiraceae bacterium]